MRMFLFITGLILLTGCKRDPKVPEDVLSRQKMEAVMWDMMQADQFLLGFVLRGDSGVDRRKESISLYQQVLAMHGVTKDEFSRSLAFYKTRPLVMKDIMDSLARTRTVAPTLPVLVSDTVPSAGEERLVQPDTAIRPGKRRIGLPVN